MPVPETNEKTAMPAPNLYEADFYAWTIEQASLLRKHQWSQLDLLNLIEEDVGFSSSSRSTGKRSHLRNVGS